MGNGQSRANVEYLKAVGAPPMMPVKRSKYSDYHQASVSAPSPDTLIRPRTPGEKMHFPVVNCGAIRYNVSL